MSIQENTLVFRRSLLHLVVIGSIIHQNISFLSRGHSTPLCPALPCVTLLREALVYFYFQKSVPIQPKSSNILPKFAKNWQLRYGGNYATDPRQRCGPPPDDPLQPWPSALPADPGDRTLQRNASLLTTIDHFLICIERNALAVRPSAELLSFGSRRTFGAMYKESVRFLIERHIEV